jgi:hypothetical protein
LFGGLAAWFTSILILGVGAAGIRWLAGSLGSPPEPTAEPAKLAGAFGGNLGTLPCLLLPEQSPGVLVKRETAGRCLRCQTGHRYGDSAPQTITVIQNGPREDHSFVSNRRATVRHDLPGIPWRQIMLYAYPASIGMMGVYLVFALSPRGETFFQDHFWRSVWWHRHAFSLAFAVLFLLPLVLAYNAGSRLVVDNATDWDVEVRVDGVSLGTLPGGHFLETRAGGGAVAVEVLVERTVVESAILKLDRRFGQRVHRMFVGRGWYLYNIAAANAYVLERPIYWPTGR